MYIKEELTLKQVERQYILNVLERNSWHYKRVAGILGVSRITLWRRLRKYDIPAKGCWMKPKGGRNEKCQRKD